ncbi:MAG: diacylglycerol kinase family lipid kinase [Deltaproteobacteria bacterium]|nr:diacylglycerol kinase family lipid kinase [Deltaproteobacteria bacterium]
MAVNDGTGKKKSRIICVVNPNSANKATGKDWPEIKEKIESVLGEVDSKITGAPGDATDITRMALENGYDEIVAVGGDGTNNEVINGFFRDDNTQINPNAVFNFISRGTGGDLRKTFGLGKELMDYIDILAREESWPVDVGRITMDNQNGERMVRYFINIASFGIGGLVDEKVNSSSKALGGKLSFLLATIRSIVEYENRQVTISLDGKKPFSRTINNVAIANGQFFGGGMWIAPGARMDDGKFDVVILGDLTRLDVLKRANRVYKGTHLELDKVESFRAARIEAFSDERVLLDVDGEQPGKLPSTFECLPGAIRMKISQPK